MSLCDHNHAKEQEDDAVTCGRHGPRECNTWFFKVFLNTVPCCIFYCCVALLGHIVHGVSLDSYTET